MVIFYSFLYVYQGVEDLYAQNDKLDTDWKIIWKENGGTGRYGDGHPTAFFHINYLYTLW